MAKFDQVTAKKTRKTMRSMAKILAYMVAGWIAHQAAADVGWGAFFLIWGVVGEALAAHWQWRFDAWWQSWYWKNMQKVWNDEDSASG